tara:strand:- start:31 stop:969 length:939 start_codon:yes stop_codon:yes gene_type:complete
MKFVKPKFWDYEKPNLLAYILLPFTFPVFIKNLFQKKNNRNKEKKILTICVGNIYIGGTGKTPLSIKINTLLNKQGFKSVIIKKFYQDQADEQKLIKKYTDLICERKRSDALNTSIKENFEIAIFDDGLQDNSINYDVKIVCFNVNQWKGNGFLMPAGPLRENISSIKKYDLIFLNGEREKNLKIEDEIKKIIDKPNIFYSYYKPSNLDEFDLNRDYVAFSGIGNPKNFYNTLIENKFKIIREFIFPDHYSFNKNDINKIIKYAEKKNALLITTEKDYERIHDLQQNKINFLKIDLIIDNEDKLLQIINKKK